MLSGCNSYLSILHAQSIADHRFATKWTYFHRTDLPIDVGYFFGHDPGDPDHSATYDQYHAYTKVQVGAGCGDTKPDRLDAAPAEEVT